MVRRFRARWARSGVRVARESADADSSRVDGDSRNFRRGRGASAELCGSRTGSLADLTRGTDTGGYNARRFDVPMLECEFARVGVTPAPFDGALVVDAQEIFFHREPRTLIGAVRFYCNDAHTGAHGARSDAV